MDGEYYNKFSSVNNLKLAWMRLKSDSSNVSYKNYYRKLFLAYEINFEEHLKILSDRLSKGSYNPSDILRFYVPKQSGLHRPITFLHLDDLIVYQAFGNIILEEFIDQRDEIENINVFSNLFNRNVDKNIFLFKKWQEGYRKFTRSIKRHYNKGNKWVAHFDLAAYYDTIDHGVLIDQFSPDTDFKDLFIKCLGVWSTHKNPKLGHGIPQGPLTSNLLAELYLLPIDKSLSENNLKYVRYVDDIKIYGESREEVLEGIILLEKECKERGLIPQAKKYEIIKAKTIDEAIGKLPSLKGFEINEIKYNPKNSFKIFKKEINEGNFNSPKVIYILKAGKKHKYILKWVLDNLITHPELADNFYQYLIQYSDDPQIGKLIYENGLSKPPVYEYTEGKYWDLLSYFEFDSKTQQCLLDHAISRLNSETHNYSLKLGLYKFLCSENSDLIYSYMEKENSALIQMMIIPYLPIIEDNYIKLLDCLMSISYYEPGLIAVNDIISNNRFYMLRGMGCAEKDQSCVIENSLGKQNQIDGIGQILNKTYDITYCDKWKLLLLEDYEHANRLLFTACNSYHIDANAWINYKDSFNEILTRRFISLLNETRPEIKWPKINLDNGEVVVYGSILDKKSKLYKNYNKIIKNFRELHMRRRQTPASHAFDNISSSHTTFVKSDEKKKYFNCLKESYNQLIQEMDELL